MSIALQLREAMVQHEAAVLGIVNPVLEQMATLEADYLKQQQVSTDFATALDASHAEIAKLEAELEATSVRAPLAERGLFVVDPTFDPATLPADELALYNGVWDHIEREFTNTILPIAASELPMHLKSMREVQDTSHYCLLVLDHYGDPRALEKLVDIWDIVLDPKNLMTGYGPGADDDPALEQPGVIRINYHGVDSGTTSAGSWDSDLHALDWCLQTGTVGETKYALRQNLLLLRENIYVRVRDYSEALKMRLKFISSIKYPGKPWWAWASTLWHPANSRFAWHYFEWLESGDLEHQEAWGAIGAFIEGSRDRVTLADGRKILLVPHTNQGWAKLFGNSNPAQGSADVTYTREVSPHDLLLMRAGSPFHTRDDVAAYARTMHLCVLGGRGGKTMKISASIAGNGPVEDKGMRVAYPNGVRVASRWVLNRQVDTEGVFQMNRGLGLVGSCLCDEPEFKTTVRDISLTTDALERKNFANRVALMLYGARR